MAKIKLAADFKDFLKLCLRNEVRFLVIGGYAVIHHSRPRYTGDLDIWIDASLENARRVVTVLQEFGFPSDAVSTEMITDRKKIIRMGFEPMRLELFTTIPGIEFSGCYERRILVKIDRILVPFISLEDLKINKLASGRPKDIQDIQELP
jgi:predicted nucleotidyltransferase